MTAEFFQGRTEVDLAVLLSQDPIPHVEDRIFSGTRLDDHAINHPRAADFAHCTFANVSFLRVKLSHFNFVDCVFLSCYFRMSDLRNCTFVGCRFIGCNFPRTDLTMERCSFEHSTFVDCYIPVKPGQYNLPTRKHNLRAELATNWAMEAEKAGATAEARIYRRIAAQAQERVDWKTALADGEYYREHYTSARDRTKRMYSFLRSRVNHYVWGYGDEAWRPAVLFVVLAVGVFPVIFLLSRGGLVKAGGGSVGWLDTLFLSLATILNDTTIAGVHVHSTWTRAVASAEAMTGLVFVGLLITLLFRWITRR